MPHTIIEEFFEVWEDSGDHDTMVELMERYLRQEYPEVEEERQQVALVKRDFESDLPPRVVADSVGCEISLCQRIRWEGGRYGVVDTRGRERESLPPSQRDRIMKRDGDQCVRCGSREELQVHHIIPISHGGFDFDDNLAMLCEACNRYVHGGDYSSRRLRYDGKEDFWRLVNEYGQ